MLSCSTTAKVWIQDLSLTSHSPASCHIGYVGCVIHKFTGQQVQAGAEIHPVLCQPSNHESKSLVIILSGTWARHSPDY